MIATQSLVYDQYYNSNNREIESLDSIFDRFSLNDYELQIIGITYEISNENFIQTIKKEAEQSLTAQPQIKVFKI